jgi:hypothetical protein
MDVTGKRKAIEKTCPFSMNERETRACIAGDCMAWTDWIGDTNAGVCALIPDTAFNTKIVKAKEIQR